MKSLFQKPWISFKFVESGLERPWFFFFKTEWCLLSFQLSSLAQKLPAYWLFCWICANKLWKWIILTFPSPNRDPTIFCPPHSMLFYLFWTILQCKDFCCFHISLWIEISPCEVGQGVAPNGCNCITEYEVEKDFQSLLKYLRKEDLKRWKYFRDWSGNAPNSTKLNNREMIKASIFRNMER